MSEHEARRPIGTPPGSSPNGRPIPDEDAAAIRVAADRFFDAVRRRDGDALWEAFSEGARAFVLNKAMEQGLDFDLATGLRDGTASEEERARYLANLVEGIRTDLRGVDLDNLTYELSREPESDQVRVRYLVEVAAGPDGGHRIPAGSLLVVAEEEGWRVHRVIPRPG